MSDKLQIAITDKQIKKLIDDIVDDLPVYNEHDVRKISTYAMLRLLQHIRNFDDNEVWMLAVEYWHLLDDGQS